VCASACVCVHLHLCVCVCLSLCVCMCGGNHVDGHICECYYRNERDVNLKKARGKSALGSCSVTRV
jgi:hypothetical protein